MEFDLDSAIAELRRNGKHFAPRDLLETLDAVRRELPAGADPLLEGFLATALDKFDGRYDNPSYLAVGILPLPSSADGPSAVHERDRLLALLVADILRFELDAALGRTDLMPELRPHPRMTAKRCRLGVRAVLPALERLGLAPEVVTADAFEAARQVSDAVAGDATDRERRLLEVTMLPVYVVHDEYMFIRVLQSYETTFAFAAGCLRAAIGALHRADAACAAAALEAAAEAMREAQPLFSLVATMQPEAFLTFRQYTEGASAIQSRNYKTVESLCRRPDAERLDSPAYRSVPEVRERVLAGQPDLETALHAARLQVEDHASVCAAMRSFEAALEKWRKSHHHLAMRMLGVRRGTGHTEGVPYLAAARSVRLFRYAAAPRAPGRGAGSPGTAPGRPPASPARSTPAYA